MEPAPPGPQDCFARALLSLDGLSCGDAFGEQFFTLPYADARASIENRIAPPGPWKVTDDTMMAISVVQTLQAHGEIQEDHLAAHFASLYDATRGYGAATRDLLQHIRTYGGHTWRTEAPALFARRGSYGNGSAMRVAPLGAWFADDLERCAAEARRSAAVTHSHPEALAGASAVALAAALSAQPHRGSEVLDATAFLEAIHARLPATDVRHGIEKALRLPRGTAARQAALVLGNGSRTTAMDTVPYTLWCAAHFMASYENALWQTVSGMGDKDTTCAIVGGIVALHTGASGIPLEWLCRREVIKPLLRPQA